MDIDNNLVLQVMVRLLDPATKQVLGRARNFTVPHPFTPRVKPDERKHVTKVTGQTWSRSAGRTWASLPSDVVGLREGREGS